MRVGRVSPVELFSADRQWQQVMSRCCISPAEWIRREHLLYVFVIRPSAAACEGPPDGEGGVVGMVQSY